MNLQVEECVRGGRDEEGELRNIDGFISPTVGQRVPAGSVTA